MALSQNWMRKIPEKSSLKLHHQSCRTAMPKLFPWLNKLCHRLKGLSKNWLHGTTLWSCDLSCLLRVCGWSGWPCSRPGTTRYFQVKGHQHHWLKDFTKFVQRIHATSYWELGCQTARHMESLGCLWGCSWSLLRARTGRSQQISDRNGIPLLGGVLSLVSVSKPDAAPLYTRSKSSFNQFFAVWAVWA